MMRKEAKMPLQARSQAGIPRELGLHLHTMGESAEGFKESSNTAGQT